MAGGEEVEGEGKVTGSGGSGGRVDPKSFVPKKQSYDISSWDPNQIIWVPHEFEFTQQSWGIKANMEMLDKGVRFTHPLRITEVAPGSEAEWRGVQLHDIVVGIRTPHDLDFRDVNAETDKSAGIVERKDTKKYVENSIRDILMKGGPCTLRIKRRRGALVCERCGSDQMVEIRQAGDLICDGCGLVCRERFIHMGSEWRTFADDDSRSDPNRTGGPENTLLNNDGMSTVIQQSGNRTLLDVAGSSANLSKNQNRGMSQSADKALNDAYKNIDRVCERMGLNQGAINKTAHHLYKQYVDKLTEIKKGNKQLEAVIASCVYIACRQESVGRTLKEMCAVTDVTKKDLGKVFKQVAQTLGVNVGHLKAKDMVGRYCSNLQLSHAVDSCAQEICDRAEKLNLTEGRVHVSIAAAAIYMACQLRSGTGDHRSCEKIAEWTGAAEATIKQTFRDLHLKRHHLVPDNYASKEDIDRLPEH